LKIGNKYYDNKNIYYKIGYWYLDKFFNKNIESDLIDKLPLELKELKTIKDLFINVIEKYFYYYDKIINLFDSPIFEDEFIIYNISENDNDDEENNNILSYRDSILRKN
jgi:hypothetical protein